MAFSKRFSAYTLKSLVFLQQFSYFFSQNLFIFVSFSAVGGDLFHVPTMCSKEMMPKPINKWHFLSLKNLTYSTLAPTALPHACSIHFVILPVVHHVPSSEFNSVLILLQKPFESS